jgi:hypothetical protein
MRGLQKEKTFVIGLVKLIFSERAVAEDIDTEKVKRLSDGLIHFGDILNDGRGCFDSGNFFYLEIDFFGKTSAERGDLEIGFSGDMINGGVEGFDGGMNGGLNAYKNSDSQSNSHHGEERPSLMIAKMTEGNVFKEVKENHKSKFQMSKSK